MEIKPQTQSLSRKVISSTFWLSSFQILDNILGFIRIIVLAKLLSPTAFGIVGAAWLTLQIINTFTYTGIQHYLIHKDKIEDYLNTAWTFLVLRGIILYALLFVSAPYLADFFNTQELVDIIRVLGLTVLINSFGNIGTIFFQKNLAFNKQFKIQITQNTVDFIVTLLIAFYIHSAWAIVFGAVANSIAGCILSYFMSDYRPRFDFSAKKFKAIFNYGKWIGGSSILEFLFSQGDDILVGKLLGVTSLGYYQLAYRISNLPATQITHIISTVMFPAYSTIQKDRKRLRDIYLKNLQVTVFLSFFVGTMIVLYANDFTLLFLGEKWLPIVASLQILTLWGVIRSIGATTGPVWQATGTPKYITYIQTLQVITLYIVIVPITLTYGFTGTSAAVVAASIIPNIIAIVSIRKTLTITLKNYLQELLLPLTACALVVIATSISNQFITTTNIFTFFIKAFISAIAYAIGIYLMHKVFKYSLFTNISNLFPALKFLKRL